MNKLSMCAAAAVAGLIAACDGGPPVAPPTALEQEVAAESPETTAALQKVRQVLRFNPKQPECVARAYSWGEEPLSMFRLKSSSGNLPATHPEFKAPVVRLSTTEDPPAHLGFVPSTQSRPFTKQKGVFGTWEVQSPGNARIPDPADLEAGRVKANSMFVNEDLNNVQIRVVTPWFKADPPSAEQAAACEASKAACPCVATAGELPPETK